MKITEVLDSSGKNAQGMDGTPMTDADRYVA